MAYIHKDGDMIEGATLGVYRFGLSSTYDASLDRTTVSVTCYKDGTSATRTLNASGHQTVVDWYIEANDTTADVYVVLGTPDLPIVNSAKTASCFNTYLHPTNQYITDTFTTGSVVEMAYFFPNPDRTSWLAVFASTESGFTIHRDSTDGTSGNYSAVSATYAGQTYWYTSHGWPLLNQDITTSVPLNDYFGGFSAEKAAAAMLFRKSDSDNVTHLVARFAIDLHDAGGTTDPELGGGVDWTDPADWDVAYDPTDPSSHTHTLNLTVEGALSGRHNDPLNDTSFSYIPTNQKPQKQYGSGGDGGHGGGGGAGASTVVVRNFATDKAMSKEIVVKVKRHGYGSGGGKGGKGGDGVILIYY